LNGYFFEAYEREEENGSKQFQLLASPNIDPQREAACIRYLVNGGLIEDLWPQMSPLARISLAHSRTSRRTIWLRLGRVVSNAG
jgi:hypothetical protein